MSHREIELRRRCERVLNGVDLPRPFTVERLCRQLGEQRGRPLHLHELPLQASSAGACGLWVATDTDDHFFIQPKTARMHREHIVLHEIGHMLFDHNNSHASDQGQISNLFTDLSPHLIQRLLARTDYSTRQEQEAEMLASLIRTRGPTGPAPAEGVLANLQASLGLGEERA